jgi:SET domain-containing protein
MSVRHIGLIDEVEVGYGVFAEDELAPGSFLGEYVGVVHGTSGSTQFLNSMQQEVDKEFGDSLAYTCQYPSCDGGLGINAIEYGNIIRFMNHSSNPNAELRYYWGEGGLMHVLCVRVKFRLIALSFLLIELIVVVSYFSSSENRERSIKGSKL